MKIKEILDIYTFEDVVEAIADMDICLFHDDYVKLTEVYDVMKASKSTKNIKDKIVFKKAPNNYPMATKELPSGKAKILICYCADVVSCEFENKTTDKMSDVTKLCYVLLHFVALELREVPYEFLKARFEANEEDDD